MVVRNAGIDWGSPDNCYWQHKVARKEATRIVLHGQSEFEASHVVLEGDQNFEVCPFAVRVIRPVHLVIQSDPVWHCSLMTCWDFG